MKVAIPSKKVSTVELRQPTFRDIKALNDVGEDILVKNALVRACVKEDISNLTVCDRDYLFFLCASSVFAGHLSFKYKCNCNNSMIVRANFSEFEVFELSPADSHAVTIKVGDQKLRYDLLTVAEEEFCIDKSFEWSGEYDEDLIKDLESSVIIRNRKFSYNSQEEFYKDFEKLSFQAVVIACDFMKIMFHGVFTALERTCSSCGKVHRIPIDFSAKVCQFATEDIMTYYHAISKYTAFDDFLSMSIPEYNAFVESLNSKHNAQS